MIKRFILIPAILLVLLTAVSGLAEPMGECIHFYPAKPIETEYFTIEAIVVTRMSNSYIMLDVYYVLPDTLTGEAAYAIEGLAFCLMADENETDYLTAAVARANYAFTENGAVEWSGPDKSIDSRLAIVPGAYLRQESQWEGVSRLPSILYVRPYYQSIDAWGDVIELSLADGMRIDVENREEVSPPLTDKETRKQSNG